MKNIKKIAAFGVIGVMVLLAVAGATLASGAGTASANTAYEQTSKVQSMNNDASDQMHRVQNQFGKGNGLMMQNGTAFQAMVCANQMNGICDGTQDKLMTQDQTRQMNCTCQSNTVYANLASGICDGSQDKLMTQDHTKLKDGSC